MSAATNEPAPKPAAEPKKKVLMLEDDDWLADVLKGYLETHDFEVVRVSNGVEGLKQVMTGDFDLILCDMLMPTLPGDMFYMAVERTKPKLCKRFVFMTGHKGNPKLDSFVRRIGGVMIFKPFEMHVLMETIQAVIKKAVASGA